MRFKLVSVGVNTAPGATPLEYAEQDAANVHALLTSDLGPVPVEDAILLVGRAATTEALNFRLATISLTRPDILLLYFSGHGGESGIGLSDGLFAYRILAEWVQMIGARRSMQILDVCRAASYLDFIKEARVGVAGVPDLGWLEVLANASPGNRLIFSTGADRNAGEGGEIAGGHFTTALLLALRQGGGDLVGAEQRFVSDRRAFAQTRQIMRQGFKLAQLPVERGLRGDFPLVKSQAEAPVGDAVFLNTKVSHSGLDLSFWVEGRRQVTTYIQYTVKNTLGRVLQQDTLVFAPTDSVEPYQGGLPLEQNVLLDDPLCYFQWHQNRRIDFFWTLTLKDEHGHILDEQVVSAFLA